MKNKKFPFGEVIDQFEYDFDGVQMSVVKYISNCSHGKVLYCCEEISQSSESIYALVIAWITWQNLGNNQWSLVDGICKALEIRL